VGLGFMTGMAMVVGCVVVAVSVVIPIAFVGMRMSVFVCVLVCMDCIPVKVLVCMVVGVFVSTPVLVFR